MLYVVPTPIGNLEDMTYRSVRVLNEMDLIACEDTRTSGILLGHYQIKTPKTSFHAHNEAHKVTSLIEQMKQGKKIALISDAGTPGISDPGFSLVRACVEAGITVEVLPGATAFVPALVGSGLPCDKFVFEGFLPQKKGRQKRLLSLETESRTMIFYESPHRLLKFLQEVATIFGETRYAVVTKELSKKFESYQRGTLEELLHIFSEMPKIRGEFVVVIAGR